MPTIRLLQRRKISFYDYTIQLTQADFELANSAIPLTINRIKLLETQ